MSYPFPQVVQLAALLRLNHHAETVATVCRQPERVQHAGNLRADSSQVAPGLREGWQYVQLGDEVLPLSDKLLQQPQRRSVDVGQPGRRMLSNVRDELEQTVVEVWSWPGDELDGTDPCVPVPRAAVDFMFVAVPAKAFT